MVDTNSNPKLVDFPIPSNDDATKSITLIMDTVCTAIKEGLEERKSAKASADKDAKAKAAKKEAAPVAEEKVEAPAAEVKVEEVKAETPATDAPAEEAK